MAKFRIHLMGAEVATVIDTEFETPEALYSAASKAGFVVGVSRKTSSNSVVSRADVLISFPAIAMVEREP